MQESLSTRYFQLFYETARTILATPELQPTLEALVQKSVAILAVRAGSLRLVDEQSHRLELVASCGLSEAYLNKGVLDSERSVPEVLAGKVVCIRDAFDDPRVQYREALRAEGLNTMLSVPVVAGEQTIGVLRLYSAEPRDFSTEELEFISAVAELGGLAIANARLYEAEGHRLAALFEECGIDLPQAPPPAERQVREVAGELSDPRHSLDYFRALHRVTRAILAAPDSGRVMQQIVELVPDILQVKACALRLLNETSNELELLAAHGLSERFLTKGPPHVDRSIRETLQGVPVLIADTRQDSRLEYPAETLAEGIASILSLPIIARSRVIGVLRVYAGQPRRYSQEDVTFLAALAEIAGIAIVNARLYESTRHDLSFWSATVGYLQDRPDR